MVLNQFPRDQYNVLIPVQSLQILSSMQKPVINRVELDTRLDRAGKPIGKDIYKEQNGEWAITKVGGMKLAAAANISIIETKQIRPETCSRCLEVAKSSGVATTCGNCESRYNVAFAVSIRVPELSGGYRIVSGTKEIDCTIEKGRMKDAQYNSFLPHRAAMAESKAFMRALRSALGLQGTYSFEDIKKPFVVAHVVPNLDNPIIQQMAAHNMLQSMGMLFERTDSEAQSALPSADMSDTPAQSPLPLPEGHVPEMDLLPEETPEFLLDLDIPICEGCSSMIQPTGDWTAERIEEYSRKRFGRPLCPECQQEALHPARGGARA